jgi:hypothetical protein
MSRAADESEGGMPPKLRGLPRVQSRLILERPPCWEHLLFTEVLLHEVAGLSDMKRDLQFGIASATAVYMTPKAFKTWMEKRIQESLGFAVAIDQIMNRALPQALGPDGEDGDPEAILYCAKKLAGVYRSAMKWRLEFLRVNVPPELEKLKAATASLSEQVAPQIEEFGSRINRELKQAIESGRPAALHFKLELTSPGTEQIHYELERLNALVKAGNLPWN